MNLKYRIGVLLLKIYQFLDPSKDKILLNFISFFLILTIGSNHPRRIKNIYKINNNIHLNEYEKIKNLNLICKRKKLKIINLFAGDSHSEFFGRNFANTNSEKLFLTFHLGPATLLEFGSSTNIINKIYKMINFLNLYYFRQDIKINLIFCLGEIDVRILFYQKIKIEKFFNNIDDCSKYLSQNFYKNFKTLELCLQKKKINNVNFYFNDIVPPSSKKYFLPKNAKQLREIKNFYKFPNLGTLENRIAYRKNLRQNIKFTLKNEKVKILDFNKGSMGIFYLSKKYSIDGVHITDLKLIKKIHKQIF